MINKNIEKFLKTSVGNQKEILQTMANKLQKSDQILEKNIWICLTLEKLFSMQNNGNNTSV